MVIAEVQLTAIPVVGMNAEVAINSIAPLAFRASKNQEAHDKQWALIGSVVVAALRNRCESRTSIMDPAGSK